MVHNENQIDLSVVVLAQIGGENDTETEVNLN